jgi:hypothetical protein
VLLPARAESHRGRPGGVDTLTDGQDLREVDPLDLRAAEPTRKDAPKADPGSPRPHR